MDEPRPAAERYSIVAYHPPTGNAIANRLVTSAGGIRRYEGDRDYGGKP